MLHNFPEDFQLTNNEGNQFQIRENVVMSTEEGDNDHMIDMDLINQYLNKEQFKHFIQMTEQKSTK